MKIVTENRETKRLGDILDNVHDDWVDGFCLHAGRETMIREENERVESEGCHAPVGRKPN